MFLIYPVGLIALVALLLHRDLTPIGQLPYRGGWQLLAVVASLFAVQVTVILFAADHPFEQAFLLIISQLALLLPLLANRHVPGARLFALGLVLNLAVMLANGGRMPLMPETQAFVMRDQPTEAVAKPASGKHIVLPRERTRFWILSDVMRMSLPWRRAAVSVGDLFLIAGVARLIFGGSNKRTRTSTDCSLQAAAIYTGLKR